MTIANQDRVARRRVFYIPGFDPMPARRYRELYRRESVKQAAISGYGIGQKPWTGAGTWKVRAKVGEDLTEARVEVLTWSDIVQQSMAGGVIATYAAMVRTAWIYLSTGTFQRLTWLRKGPVIAALYPICALIGQLVLAVLLARFVGGQVSGAVGWATGIGWLGTLAGLGVGLALIWVTLQWFARIDGRVFAHYLMQDYAFVVRDRGAWPPELEARMAVFGDKIAAALRDNVDEVLVVAHSSGAQIAVSVLADLVRAGAVAEEGPELSLLTLGQAIPMQSFLPRADKLRSDLNFLSRTEALAWVDVSAPGDGCAFALCDPVAVSGAASRESHQPLVLSAAFSDTLAPATWGALRWRFFRLHFQYLCAFDKPRDYDYFAITAGPMTLDARFRGRLPSKSRIDVAASPHTSRAA
ncbi:MAG: hypothetical protein AAFX45_04045 [Pseudomonadota bacterium]